MSISRRNFLKGFLVSSASAMIGPSLMVQTAAAATKENGNWKIKWSNLSLIHIS